MDVANIKRLEDKLTSLGFVEMQGAILKRVCFSPSEFIIIRKVAVDKDRLTFCFYFKQHNEQYHIIYYDATLQKEIIFQDTTIESVAVKKLDQSMAGIDWENAFAYEQLKDWQTEVKLTWENELKIHQVVQNVQRLQKTAEGKPIAEVLKSKYWAGLRLPDWILATGGLKNKNEVSQRFFFPDNGDGITMNEAVRFLQNKWLEKVMQESQRSTGRKATIPVKKLNMAKKNSKQLKDQSKPPSNE